MISSLFILFLGFFIGLICYLKPMWIIGFLACWIKFALGQLTSSEIVDSKLAEALWLLGNNQNEFELKYQNQISKIEWIGLLVLLISSLGLCGRIADI